ncbi:uncharacterized protein LOC128266227 isoform X1 [Drosophila gunungcola]|uniref:DUF229 domain containing protein n=2 Tax=Drosophila gunungcola TaxID=103775 RepID=A0A9Q0BUI2_9MUSC|nr:uncharacterized protein LOC128266227 isoform X1 [Drosophila gunungcola]KAI8044420.1 hypothetical protein M5D96_000579 [Drosophila gunungcola]
MINLFYPILKWLCFCFIAVIVTLNLINQTSNTRYRKLRVSKLTVDESEIPVTNTYTAKENTEAALPLFFVETAKCKIPYVNPFEADDMASFHPEHFETCSNESALVTPIYDVSRRRYVLFINKTLASILLNSSEGEYNCYYQEITRDRQHDSYDKVERKYFTQNYELPLHVQGMILACHRLGNESDVLQSDAYTLIQYKPPPKGLSLEPAKRKPSVLMFGIDSLSRINLRRTMPKVYNFLQSSGWYELQGYNKVGDNTFPNLMAILTGYSEDSALNKVCDWKTRGCLDETPFIWKFLRNASYLTAYAEDESSINTFNYLKPGFVEQPTDFYLRPFQKAFESGLNTWKCQDCTMKYCIGRRITSSYAYDMARDFAKRFVDERPIWGLFWSNSFSHDSWEMPSKMDDYVLQYLLDFEADGVFEQSIMVFLSDHGSRYGHLMSLPSGFLEERLPSMFIYLPPWFRAQYPEYASALQGNQNRLTSNYDLHNTLKHIIELGGSTVLPKSVDCPQCQSLFLPVAEARSCEEAGIPDHYCTCEPYKRIQANWAKRIAPGIIGRINEYLAGRNLSGICWELTLSYIHKTEMKIGLDHNFHGDLPIAEVATYRTMFKVKQNTADFRATVLFNNVTGSVEVSVPSISRLDRYKDVSTCVDDKTDKKYCICKSDFKV